MISIATPVQRKKILFSQNSKTFVDNAPDQQNQQVVCCISNHIRVAIVTRDRLQSNLVVEIGTGSYK